MWRSFVFFCQGRPVLAPPKERAAREAQCQICPHRELDTCLLCLCMIDAKVCLSAEECPDDPPRWPRLTSNKNIPIPNEFSNE